MNRRIVITVMGILLVASLLEQVATLVDWVMASWGKKTSEGERRITGWPDVMAILRESWIPVLLHALTGALREGCRVTRARLPNPMLTTE